jgi:riboflavin kinase/FMN adenylyltransferase
MEIVTDPTASVAPAGGSAVTIGAYDGVHIGHQALLADLRTRAQRRGLATVVVTFDRHPATVVRPDSAPLLLCDLAQKLELLAATGVDRTVVVHFDEERANESAEDFVSEILIGAVASKLIVVGEDFHFGHGRKGNVALLKEMGVDAGFTVEGMSLATAFDDGAEAVPISSTRIRSLVAEGRVAEAATLLGRPHQVRGVVVRGDGRGGTDLGFPTANVEVPAGIAVPAVGIYAGWYERPDGSRWPTAVAVGTRPTFYGDQGPLMVEAFLLDFEGDLYGEEARVSFVAQVRRDEVRFESVDELVAQMDRDVEATRIALSHD